MIVGCIPVSTDMHTHCWSLWQEYCWTTLDPQPSPSHWLCDVAIQWIRIGSSEKGVVPLTLELWSAPGTWMTPATMSVSGNPSGHSFSKPGLYTPISPAFTAHWSLSRLQEHNLGSGCRVRGECPQQLLISERPHAQVRRPEQGQSVRITLSD